MKDSIGITTYPHDSANRLTSIYYPASSIRTISYTYDSVGTRLTMTSQSPGQPVTSFTMGLGIDEPIKLKRGSDVAFYHTDALGSVQLPKRWTKHRQ